MIPPRPNSISAASRESGVALVLVLWMLALLATIAHSLAFSSRTDVLAAGNQASQAQAEAYADAAVHRAVRQLARNLLTPVDQTDPWQWKADGITRIWRYRDAEIGVTIIRESGKIDINTAPPTLLGGLFTSNGIDQAKAVTLVDAILDWRDNDELRRLHGAERAEYATAGLRHVPGNADFLAIDELRQVLGMSDDLFMRIEPLITVHSYESGIDLTTAPRDILLALPNATPAQVDRYLSERQALLLQGLPVPPFGPAQGFTAGSSNPVFGIQVEVVLSDNTRYLRQAVVRLSGVPNEPVRFLAWRAPHYGPGWTAPNSEKVDSDVEIR